MFVGLEIRQSNVQARAASYQALGIATAEFHRKYDDRLAALAVQSASQPESLANWSAVDWERSFRSWVDALRLFETLLLQVEQGLLPQDALGRLGWENTPRYAWSDAAFNCLWPTLERGVGVTMRALLVEAAPSAVYDCSHIDLDTVWKPGTSPD